MEKYLTTDGVDLSNIDSYSLLKLEHILQRYRDAWIPNSNYPYLSIDKERVEEYLVKVGDFAVFASVMLFQNISRTELGQRVIASLAGPGLTGGFSPSGRVIVEGLANPQAHGLFGFNAPLLVGTHPFAASGTQYIYVSSDALYQRKFADLITVNKYSRPKSPHVDFNPLSDFVEALWHDYLGQRYSTGIDLSALSGLLDNIFAENEKVLTAATEHHRAMAPHERALDYPAPVLTKYGRLTHSSTGDPRVEVSFALLHYETAILEFNKLKKTSSIDDSDAAFRHGIYCIVAAAACVEATGNILVFSATSQHPDYRDRRQPLQKINESATIIAQAKGVKFTPLAPNTPVYDDLDALRIARNSFMHAKELESDIDPLSRKPSCAAAVDETSCRRYLESLRVAIAQVYDQLPGVPPPIMTRTNVTWLQDMEVP
ncbi:MAG: hypothetical protein WC405_11605 [Syntrophales bacterium]